jgi:hypothetical protein
MCLIDVFKKYNIEEIDSIQLPLRDKNATIKIINLIRLNLKDLKQMRNCFKIIKSIFTSVKNISRLAPQLSVSEFLE